MTPSGTAMPPYRPLTEKTIINHPAWDRLSPELREAVTVVSQVLPFRVNEHVVESLIDWPRVPDDPMFQLTFPQREMLDPEDYELIRSLLVGRAPEAQRRAAVNRIRLRLNPHPAGQLTHNVPRLGGRPVPGLQHKYRETVLFFPGGGQTCHAYCTYCFRWAQFVGLPELKFEARETDLLVAYLRAHPEVTDVLITGGDPLIMKASLLRRYVEPLLTPELAHVRNIRIGTKSLSYWPQRFVTDPDADETLRLFEDIRAARRQLAFMAHFSHPVELEPPITRKAIRRVKDTGAEIRLQAPLVRRVNDRPDAWADMWRGAVSLGMIPYYMFVERDTGPKRYFEVPLARGYEIFRAAYRRVSGLARTVRGPSMSAFPGKVRILGIAEIANQQVFVLDLIQARKPQWVRRPFFAKFDPHATWLDDLEPAFEERFFFESGGGVRHLDSPAGHPR